MMSPLTGLEGAGLVVWLVLHTRRLHRTRRLHTGLYDVAPHGGRRRWGGRLARSSSPPGVSPAPGFSPPGYMMSPLTGLEGAGLVVWLVLHTRRLHAGLYDVA